MESVFELIFLDSQFHGSFQGLNNEQNFFIALLFKWLEDDELFHPCQPWQNLFEWSWMAFFTSSICRKRGMHFYNSESGNKMVGSVGQKTGWESRGLWLSNRFASAHGPRRQQQWWCHLAYGNPGPDPKSGFRQIVKQDKPKSSLFLFSRNEKNASQRHLKPLCLPSDSHLDLIVKALLISQVIRETTIPTPSSERQRA